MEIETELGGVDGEVLIVRAPRELSHETAEPLRGCVMGGLPDREGAGVVIDLSAVELITSIGIALLLEVQEFGLDRGATTVLAATPVRHLEFLRMLRLDRKFVMAATVEEGVMAVVEG